MSEHSEWDKMVSGLPYSYLDPELCRRAAHAKRVLREFNAVGGEASPMLAALFARTGTPFYVETGFYCDYGCNISVGDHFYANAGVTILDVCPVTIGDWCMIGPQVGIYTATHPIDGAERRKGLEYGKAVAIGDDVWIGGHAVVGPGVTIGSNVVVAAGAVVTRDVPDNCVVAGSPARIIRHLEEEHGL